jgi:hypothetical protein
MGGVDGEDLAVQPLGFIQRIALVKLAGAAEQVRRIHDGHPKWMPAATLT